MQKTLDQINKERRLQRAKELAKEIKDGEYQQPALNKLESFFPQREVIKKDKVVMRELYKNSGEPKKDA